MSTYAIKEIYYTIQGEGMQTGRPAIFCRFTGCNLWSGRAEDRDAAICTFCDTDFVGTDGEEGGRYTLVDLVDKIETLWPLELDQSNRYVVCTGGEPLLQLDKPLIAALHARHFEIAIETNGTKHAPDGIDWICMSPKPNTDLLLQAGDELKLVYPQQDIQPEDVAGLDYTYFFLQPMDGPNQATNTQAAVDYCLRHPKWRLSLQTHKYTGLK